MGNFLKEASVEDMIERDDVSSLRSAIEQNKAILLVVLRTSKRLFNHQAKACARYVLEVGGGNFSFVDAEIPLISAINSESLEFLEFLVECGANLNQHDKYMSPVLAFLVDAKINDDLRNRMAEILIMAGADPNLNLLGKKLSALQQAKLIKRPDIAQMMLVFWDLYTMNNLAGKTPVTHNIKQRARL